jgi:hypothetical protein
MRKCGSALFLILLANALACGYHTSVVESDRLRMRQREIDLRERARPYAGCYEFTAGEWQYPAGHKPVLEWLSPAFVPPRHLKLELEDRIGYLHIEPQPDSTSPYYKQAGWLYLPDRAPYILFLIWVSDVRAFMAPVMVAELEPDLNGYRGKLVVRTDAVTARPFRNVAMIREPCAE